jgi:hypothetical protein
VEEVLLGAAGEGAEMRPVEVMEPLEFDVAALKIEFTKRGQIGGKGRLKVRGRQSISNGNSF